MNSSRESTGIAAESPATETKSEIHATRLRLRKTAVPREKSETGIICGAGLNIVYFFEEKVVMVKDAIIVLIELP
jgi:hypothetical protein